MTRAWRMYLTGALTMATSGGLSHFLFYSSWFFNDLFISLFFDNRNFWTTVLLSNYSYKIILECKNHHSSIPALVSWVQWP